MADDVLAMIAAYIPTMDTFPSAGPVMIDEPVWTAEQNCDRSDCRLSR
jgi:hypothetical protein